MKLRDDQRLRGCSAQVPGWAELWQQHTGLEKLLERGRWLLDVAAGADHVGTLARAEELRAEAREVFCAHASAVYSLREGCEAAAARGLVALEFGGIARVAARAPAGAGPGLDWVLVEPEGANVVARVVGRWRGLEYAVEVEHYIAGSVSSTWEAALARRLDANRTIGEAPAGPLPGDLAALQEAWGWSYESPAMWRACPIAARVLQRAIACGAAWEVCAAGLARRHGPRLGQSEAHDAVVGELGAMLHELGDLNKFPTTEEAA